MVNFTANGSDVRQAVQLKHYVQYYFNVDKLSVK